ncbi:MAG: hypothetical protein P8L85_13305 [Rubripirellula sp.]|nr:hypothetical protein [Rubripirellula sp.]
MLRKSLPLLLVALVTSWAQAHTPVEFLEVVEGKPSNLIEHGIELKGIFDDEKSMTNLKGPYRFSAAVGCLGRKAEKQKAYLAWYKIVAPKQERQRKVACVDLIRGADSTPLTIGSAEFFVSPAQRITTGAPTDIPSGLDHFKAYRIIDAPSREMDVTLTESMGPPKRRIGKPAYLCIASEEWHHDEFFPATHRRTGFVVYELEPQQQSEKITLIDQFGLNQVITEKSQWLAVTASLSTNLAE